MLCETPFDVLKKSIQLHPSTFADACQNEANDDWRYIARRLDMPEHARRCAVARAEALTFAADSARHYVDPGGMPGNCRNRITARKGMKERKRQ